MARRASRLDVWGRLLVVVGVVVLFMAYWLTSEGVQAVAQGSSFEPLFWRMVGVAYGLAQALGLAGAAMGGVWLAVGNRLVAVGSVRGVVRLDGVPVAVSTLRLRRAVR